MVTVVHRALHLFSLFCCVIIVASFVMFARDQVAGASRHQQNELVVGSSVPAGSAASTQGHRVAGAKKSQPRAFIDGTAHTLTGPFDSVISSTNPWVVHGVPAAFGLLIYGLGVGFAARFTRLTP
jgi:hypothetical protein